MPKPPNENQLKAIECLSNHCLAVAIPGSGKTLVLAHKAAHILSTNPDAKIMITTFTRDAASSIRRRIITVAGAESASRIACGTFHSLALDQLKKAGFHSAVIGDAQARQFVERALAECKISNLGLDVAVSIIERLRSLPSYEPSNDDYGRLYISYSSMLLRNKVTDMSGILLDAVKLMLSGKLPPKTCNYLLVDESQDIDELQFAWCKEHIKAGARCTMVGDDDQSIYKFRFALGYQGMMRFGKEYGADFITLDENYRCRAEILNAAGKLILHNQNRVPKEPIAARGMGGSVEAWRCLKSVDEARLVVRKIVETCASNENPNPDKFSVGVKDGEWAVLARNKHNLNILAMALAANGIPHTKPETDLWAEQPICFAIGLLSSLLTKERNGFDAALYFSGVDQQTMTRCLDIFDNDYLVFLLYANEKHLSQFDEGTAKKLLMYTKSVQMWLDNLTKGRVNNVIRGVFEWFIGQLKWKSNWKENKKLKREIKLLSSAGKILAEMDVSLKKRLQRVTLKYSDNKEKTVPLVFLNTLHASKGLEFDNVWLLQIDEYVIPDVKNTSCETEEEERRVMYVGMTRAKNALYVSCTKKPSRFIFEAGIELKDICG